MVHPTKCGESLKLEPEPEIEMKEAPAGFMDYFVPIGILIFGPFAALILFGFLYLFISGPR